MKVRREAGGKIATLAAEDFRREFGARYAPCLAAAEPLPSEFLRACVECADGFARREGAGAIEVLRRRLASPGPSAGYVADAGPRVGRGLFAERPIPTGTFIGEYAGVLTRDWAPVGRGGRFNPYLLKYPFESAYAIDAETRGNELRFVNHSRGGANARRVCVLFEGLLRVVFVADRVLAPDEQILIDYGPDYRFASAPEELKP